MKRQEFKSLEEISPEEFARIERLALRRGPFEEGASLVLGVGLLTLLILGVAGYFVLPLRFEITLVSLAVLCGVVAAVLLGFWWLAYMLTERPRDMARQQLEHLKQEMRAREDVPKPEN